MRMLEIATLSLNFIMIFAFLGAGLSFFKKYKEQPTEMFRNFAIGLILISVVQVLYSLKSAATIFGWSDYYILNQKLIELVMLFYFPHLLLAFMELFGISSKVRFWFQMWYYLLIIVDIAYLATEHYEVVSHVARTWFAVSMGIVGVALIYHRYRFGLRGLEFIGFSLLSWLFQGILESVLLATGKYSFFVVTVIGAINTTVMLYGFYLASTDIVPGLRVPKPIGNK